MKDRGPGKQLQGGVARNGQDQAIEQQELQISLSSVIYLISFFKGLINK